MFYTLRRWALAAALLSLSALTAQANPLEIDGRQVEIRSEGDGQPVIFVHGALSDLRVWDQVIDALSEHTPGFRFVAYTQRHFGPGDGPLGMPEDFTRETHVFDLIRLAETVGDGTPVTLVTWSYGGEIGLHAMKQRPDLFGAAVHYEPILFPLLAGIPGGERARLEKVRTMFAPAVAIAKKGDLEGAAMRFMERAFLMPVGSAISAIAPWPEIWRDNGRTIPAYGTMAPMPIACADFKSINSPTLVVQGIDTHIDTAMMADQVTACLGNAFSIHVPGANHGIPMRTPENFAKTISGFLTTIN